MKQAHLCAQHLEEMASFIRKAGEHRQWKSGVVAGTDGQSNGIRRAALQSTSRARTLATFLISSRGIAAVVSVAVCTLSLRRDRREEIAICGPLGKLITGASNSSDVRPNLR